MKKNKILITIFTLLLSFTSLQAKEMKCASGKCGASMNSNFSKTDSKLLRDIHQKDGFKIILESKKPIVTGNNEIFVTIFKGEERVTNVKVKIKFFMPQMPGMPYMEHKEKLKLSGNSYKGTVNFSMGGTWQYQLKFKDKNKKVRTLRGSINL